jgi:hypothetical protein
MVYLGFAIGLVALRWGTNGVMVLLLAAILVAGLAAVVIGWLGDWSAVWARFRDQPAIALILGWPALLTAVAAATSWLGPRRVAV